MSDLLDQPNIGKECAKKLKQVGINTFEELKEVLQFFNKTKKMKMFK